MKRLAPVLGVVLLIVALVFVNRGISRTAQPDDDDAPPPKSSQPKTPPAANPGPPDPAAQVLAPEVTLGDPAKAEKRMTVGWVYDEATQADPTALVGALTAIRQVVGASGGHVSAEIVNLDVPAEELSPAARSVVRQGVSINGQPVGAAVNPGSPGLPPPAVMAVLQARPTKG